MYPNTPPWPGYWPPYPTFVPPNGGCNDRNSIKERIKEMKAWAKFMKADEEEKKKKASKPPPGGPSSFEVFAIMSLLSPIIGPIYLYAVKQLLMLVQ